MTKFRKIRRKTPLSELRPGTRHFIEKETLKQVFSCELCEISKHTYFEEDLRKASSGIHAFLTHISSTS